MEHFPSAPETQPHGPADLKDQSTVFLMLEELGIASMQRDWLRANAPDSDDCAAAVEQADEFLEDTVAFFSGRADAARVLQNGWAGAAVSAHLRRVLSGVLAAALKDGAEAADDETVVRTALAGYLESLRRLTARQEEMAAAGEKMSPAEYIQLMAAWSGAFSGAANEFALDPRLHPQF